MRVVASLLSYPPHRFIGSELMTHALLTRLRSRGHEVTVVVRDGPAPWEWEGITVTGGPLPSGVWHPLPAGDVLIYHAEFHEGSVDNWPGPKVAVCHNAREGVKLGLYNCRPDIATVNSEWMSRQVPHSRKLVVHPPVPPDSPVNGDRVGLINLEATSKVGPFWEVAKLMRPLPFLGVRGGYGEQSVPKYVPANVRVIDPVAPDRMTAEVWSHVRVLMVPSATESWSMVASEAMAHGIPVIAEPLPGLEENLHGVGSWAHRDNPAEWVDRISTVLAGWGDYSLAARGRAGMQRERHDFEADVWCEAVEALC